MKATSKNIDNIYYFDKKTKTKKSRHDTVRRDFRRIPRANNPAKGLSRAARTLAANYDDMLRKSKTNVIFRKHQFISTITEVEERQNANLHKELSDIFHIQYHQSVVIKNIKYRDGFTIQRTEHSEEILQNPELFYSKIAEKNYDLERKKLPPRPKKFSSKITHKPDITKVSGNLEYRLEEEQESLRSSLSSSFKEVTIKERNNARAQETENTICSNAILTEHSQIGIPEPKETVTACDDTNKPKLLTASEEKAIHLQRMQRDPNEQSEGSLSALMKKIISKQENIGVLQLEVETIPSISPPQEAMYLPEKEILSNKEDVFMKQEETNLIPDKETRKMLLSKAIFDAFGATANEIQDNCSFEEISPLKVCIKPAIGVSFNDIEKAKIRRCVQSVYGEDVVLALVNTNLYVNKEPVASESGLAKSEVLLSNSCNNPQWLRFKAELTKVLLKKHEEKIAHHILKNWFDKLRVSDDTTSQKLILVGSVFTIQWIDDKFGLELENAVLAGNLTIELRDEANRNRPLIFSKETIKRG